ncbi:LADA_0C01244g1_1 [Lachancea dasiensis]|uniref:LADA_0C01244g1_1 n=1 Tax=Lachancea dasiensis TaxID=1072105 RepID=A0A1G4IY10_9SACH|nr:LADA_0C01244g1_1 [Lachancea dasiensis]
MSFRRREVDDCHNTVDPGLKKSEFFRPRLGSQGKHGSIRQQVHWRYLIAWLCLWVCLIQYYEVSVVKRAMKRCQWSNWEEWPETATPHHMAVLADPQIMDAHSYPGRPWIANYFTQQVVDNYHARNWKYMHHILDPHSTFFLGDLFDGGRRWNDSDWMQEYKRFNQIFPKKPNRLTVMSLPGNHDIGFGDTVIPESWARFSTYFGDPSSKWDVGNHTIVLLDTISLSDSQNEAISAVPREFLDRFDESPRSTPRVLMTHVPLWRDPNKQLCGAKRESQKPFPMAKGEQYQTVIDWGLSQEVLQKIEPSLVLSGDDHDYCHIEHTYLSDRGSTRADEITVKSCAMNMGISRPAIQLLSLYNPDLLSTSKDTYHTNICYLPDPYKALRMYVYTYVSTILFLFWIIFLPKSFNKVLESAMLRGSREFTHVLPIATKKHGLKATQEDVDDLLAVNGNRKIRRFVMNVTVMTFMIFWSSRCTIRKAEIKTTQSC